MTGHLPERHLFLASALELAPQLLGAVLSHRTEQGTVSVQLTEVEAYQGAVDPGSHAFRGRTRRNSVMFGEPGHLYAYFSYGMHTCANIVCSPAGTASGILLRGGRVVDGVELARARRGARRSTAVADRDLARGPARLTVALGITLADDGADLLAGAFGLQLPERPSPVASGPRTGVSGAGGGDEYPWRFWIPGDRTVSAYRRHPRSGSAATAD